MTHLSLRQWNGQFQIPKVVRKIRQIIAGRIAAGGCVCVYDDNASGLTPEVKAEITHGWPPSKVMFSHAHPSAGRTLGNPAKKGRKFPGEML